MPTILIGATVAIANIAIAALEFGQTVQWIAILVGIATAVAIGRSRLKDEAIKDLKNALEGAAARADNEHEERRKAERQADELRGKVEMLSLYAAPEAFKSIDHTLGELRATIGESISAQGELILKNIERSAAAVNALERVAIDLEKLAVQVHPETLEKVAADLGRLADRLGAGGDRPAQI